jgi:hypothetical protein
MKILCLNNVGVYVRFSVIENVKEPLSQNTGKITLTQHPSQCYQRA